MPCDDDTGRLRISSQDSGCRVQGLNPEPQHQCPAEDSSAGVLALLASANIRSDPQLSHPAHTSRQAQKGWTTAIVVKHRAGSAVVCVDRLACLGLTGELLMVPTMDEVEQVLTSAGSRLFSAHASELGVFGVWLLQAGLPAGTSELHSKSGMAPVTGVS